MLTLEQLEEARPRAGSAAKGTWRNDWKSLSILLPILLPFSFLLIEMVLVQLWWRDELFSLAGLLRLVLAAALPFLAVFLEVGLRLLLACLPFGATKSVARAVHVDEKGVKFSPSKYAYARWSQIRRWFLTPISGQQGFVTLTLECGTKKGPLRHYWSMLITEREQKHALLSELEYLRQIGKTEASVIELSRPLPERRLGMKGLWTSWIAFYLFIHGFPLLAVGLGSHDHKEPAKQSSPAEQLKIERSIVPILRRFHITNERELRRLFWISGSSLTGAGILCFFWGNKRRNREMAEANRLFDLDVEASRLDQRPAMGLK